MRTENLIAGKFPTQVLHSHSFNDLIFAETTYRKGQVVERHSHKQAGFIIVLNGEFIESHEDQQGRLCSSSDVIFRPADLIHANAFKRSAARCFNVQFGSAWSGKLQRFSNHWKNDHPLYFSRSVLFSLGLKLYKEFRMPDVDSLLIMEGIALQMIGEANRLRFHRQESKVPAWLKKVRDHLHSSLVKQFTIPELAMEAGVHPIYLNRAFRKHYGQSIGEYLRTLRLEFCYSQLACTNTSIAQISLAAGFYDQGHFCRAFKKSFGMTPLAFRRFSRKV